MTAMFYHFLVPEGGHPTWEENCFEKIYQYTRSFLYEGGSICNENPFMTPARNALGIHVICQTKDQSVAVIMVHRTLFYLSKFNKLQTF